jgi:Na+/H+-dicarboxylate symporter
VLCAGRGTLKLKLYTKIFIGLVLGAVVGIVMSLTGVGQWGARLQPVGDIFINLIKMVVIPLVMASIILGTASLGDLRSLGRIGLKTIAFYLIGSALAVAFGLLTANLFQPGSGLDDERKQAIVAEVQKNEEMMRRIQGAEASAREERGLGQVLTEIIPANPIQAMAEGQMLPIIFFSILFGIALTMVKEGPRSGVMGLLEGINDAMIVLVNGIMAIAPYAVFAIITAVTAQLGIEFLISLMKYALVTLGTMVVFYIVFYALVVRLMGGTSPLKFFKAMRPVGLIAFSTCSSNATLPENMMVCQRDLGVSKPVASFVLPLGATINMNGTAIYQGISVMFISQVFMPPGQALSLSQQLTVVVTAVLASVGAAGVPGAGMVMLAMVLSSVGLPTAGIAVVLGVERILDMCRTVLNVTGDAAAAVFVGHTEGGLKPPEEEAEAA